MLKVVKIPAHLHYKDILIGHLRVENHLYFAYKTSLQQAQMVPLKPTIGSASLTKFIATRFFITMFSAFLWISLHLMFALHLTYISENLIFPLQLWEGHEGPCRKQLMPVLLRLLFLCLPIRTTHSFCRSLPSHPKPHIPGGMQNTNNSPSLNKFCVWLVEAVVLLCRVPCEVLYMYDFIYCLQ